MPKLGLGINLANKAGVSPNFTDLNLYSDSFIAYPNSGYSFVNRQFFSSGLASNLVYGSGVCRQNIGTSGRHLIGYFDCNAEQYPTYDNGVSYPIGAIVYGGVYGHGLFQRTGNPNNPGYPPNLLFTPSGTQDASGWTRIHPILRTILFGEELTVKFNLLLNPPQTTLANSNAVRFGLFNSFTDTVPLIYTNADNLGLSNAIYGGTNTGYRGYMSGISSNPSNTHRINTRTLTTDPRLMTTTTGVYTENLTGSFSGLTTGVTYSITLNVKRINSGALVYTSSISGGSLSGAGTTLSWTDNSPSTYSFDTLAVLAIANSCASFDLSNVTVTFKKSVPKTTNLFNPLLRLSSDFGVTTSGTDVVSWADSTNNNSQTQALAGTTSVSYVTNSLNGKPVLRFNGTAGLLTPTVYPFNYNYPFTLVGVSKASGSNAIIVDAARYFVTAASQTNYDAGLSYGRYGSPVANFSGFIGKSYSGSNDIESSPIGENVVGLSILISDGTTVSHYLNGQLIGTLSTSLWNSSTLNTGKFSIGCEYTPNINTTSFFGRCDIAELCFYNRAITTNERQQVENYLNTKYAIY